MGCGSYKHVSVWRLVGLQLNKPIWELYADDSRNLFLTKEIDSYLYHFDRKRALVYLSSIGGLSMNVKKRLESRIKEIQDLRQQEHSVYLIFLEHGPHCIAESPFTVIKDEWEDIIVRWSNPPSSSPQQKKLGPSSEEIALWAALAEISLCPRQVKFLGDFVTEFNEDGRQVITIAARGNDANFSNCSVVDHNHLKRLQGAITGTQEDHRINHALTLLSLSANDAFDDMRTFHINWVAFELFVEELSTDYKKQYLKVFSSPIGTGDFATIQSNLIYGPSSKKKFSETMISFAWIAAYLDKQSADADFIKVDSVRKFRNNFIHQTPQLYSRRLRY